MCFNVLGRHIISPHPAIPMPRALGRPLPQGRGRGLYRLPLEGGAGQSCDSGSGLRGWLRANDRLEFAAARGVTPSDRCAATSPLKGEGICFKTVTISVSPKTVSSLPPDGPYRGPYFQSQPRLIYRRSGIHYRRSG